MANSKKKYVKKRSINRNKYNRTIKRKQRGGAAKKEELSYDATTVNLNKFGVYKTESGVYQTKPTLVRLANSVLQELTTTSDNDITEVVHKFVEVYNKSIEDYKTSVENIKTTITGVKGEEYSSWCEIYRDATKKNSVYKYFVRVLNYMKLYGPVETKAFKFPSFIDSLSSVTYPRSKGVGVLDTYYNNLFNAMDVETTLDDAPIDDDDDDDVLKYLIILSGLFKICVDYKDYQKEFDVGGLSANEYVGKLFRKLSYSELVDSLIKKLYFFLTNTNKQPNTDKQPNILRRVLFVLCISFKVLTNSNNQKILPVIDKDKVLVFTVTTTSHLYKDSANIPKILLGGPYTGEPYTGEALLEDIETNFLLKEYLDLDRNNNPISRKAREEYDDKQSRENYLAKYYESLVFPKGTETHLEVLNKSLEGVL